MTDQQNNQSTDESTGSVTTTPTDNLTQNPATPPKGYVAQEVYAGLQKSAQKKSEEQAKQLADMATRLETLTTELEGTKLDKSTTESEKARIDAAKRELETQLGELQVNHQKTARQLSQQTIVLSEFPQLAPLAGFIPSADTEEDFRKNAKDFSKALDAYVKKGVSAALEGSAPPVSGGTQKIGSSESAVDAAWKKVYALAGQPGKEQQYDEAYKELLELIPA